MFHDGIVSTTGEHHNFIVRAVGGRYVAPEKTDALSYTGVTSIFTIKQWGTKGYK